MADRTHRRPRGGDRSARHHNLVSAGLAAAFDQLTITTTAADMPWQFAAADVLVLAAYALVVVKLANRRGLSTVAAVPPPQAVPPALHPASSEVT